MEHSTSAPSPSLLLSLTRNRDSNYNPQELREQGSWEEGDCGANIIFVLPFGSALSLRLALPGSPPTTHAPGNILASNVQGAEASGDPRASYLRITAASSRLKKSLQARARRGEARPPRHSRGLPQRPPSSRRRSGRATAGRRQHHLILRSCRGATRRRRATRPRSHLPAGMR